MNNFDKMLFDSIKYQANVKHQNKCELTLIIVVIFACFAISESSLGDGNKKTRSDNWPSRACGRIKIYFENH